LDWIDAHHHLWDLSRIRYPWLMARGEKRFFGQPDPIRKDYLPGDFRRDTAGRIAQSVHIQVGARPEDELAETAFIDECSAASGGVLPAAAVVAIDMGQPDITRDLSAHLAYGVVRGVRHMIGKSPEENHMLPPFRPRVWIPNFKRLVPKQLTFDLQLTEDQYGAVLDALHEVPELKVAICHLASPWDRSAAGFSRWKRWMRRFSELPGMHMKISGLSMFTQCWDPQGFRRYAEASLDIFGAGRCMFGSNFPVDSLYVSYDDLLDAWVSVSSACSESDARLLAGETARSFYRL
jgi:predicted TIM-barrel fold metal-dependent hydrolase